MVFLLRINMQDSRRWNTTRKGKCWICLLSFSPKMLLKLKKDWGDIFNSSSIKMNSSSVASLLNPEEKKYQKITALFFSYLEPYPNQNLVIENSGMTMLSDQEYVIWSVVKWGAHCRMSNGKFFYKQSKRSCHLENNWLRGTNHP